MKGGVEFCHCIVFWCKVFAAFSAHVHVLCEDVNNEREAWYVYRRVWDRASFLGHDARETYTYGQR
jgi:hypothetical protein